MADKVYKLSLEQLNDIVSDAVTNAIKKLDHIEVEDEQPKSLPDMKVGDFSDEQYREAIATMQRNRGAGEEPKVGLFWWNVTLKELFGIVTHKRYGWWFESADCRKQLAKCERPMLFIHGDADDFVPFEHLWENYHAKTKGYKEYWVAPGAVHANSYAKYPEEYTRRVNNFLNTVRYLPEDFR